MENTTSRISETSKTQLETPYFSDAAIIVIAVALTAIISVGIAIGQAKYNFLTKGIQLAIANPAATFAISLVVVGALLYVIIQNLSSKEEEDIEKGSTSLNVANDDTTNKTSENQETDSNKEGSSPATSPTTSANASPATSPKSSPTLTSKPLLTNTTTSTSSITTTTTDEVTEDKNVDEAQGVYEKLQKEFPILKRHMNEDYWKACLKGQEGFLTRLDFSGLPPLNEEATRAALEKFNQWPVNNDAGVSIIDVPAGITEQMIEELLKNKGDGFVVTRHAEIFTKGRYQQARADYNYLEGEDKKPVQKAYRVMISRDILTLSNHKEIEQMLVVNKPKGSLDNITKIQDEAKKLNIMETKELTRFENEKERLNKNGMELPNFLAMTILMGLSYLDENNGSAIYAKHKIPCQEVVNGKSPVIVGGSDQNKPGIYIGHNKAYLGYKAGNTALAGQVTLR